MDATHYWPFAREYSIWNTTVTALQFWMADLEPHILSNAIEQVYTAFFCSNSAQQLWNRSEEIIFGCFVTTLNDVFEWEIVWEGEGYENGSKSLNIHTPLQRAPFLYHVSTSDNLSFDPATPLTTVLPHPAHSPQWLRSHTPVCCHLMFSSSDEESPSPDSNPSMEEQSCLHQYSTTWITNTHLHQAQMTPPKILQQKKRKILHQPHWMMTFGLQIQFQIDICVFMNSQNHITSVPIPAHTARTCHIQLQKMDQDYTTK